MPSKKAKYSKKPKAHKKIQTEEEMDRENGQLDNLFLTLREGIVENIDSKKQEKHEKHKHHKKGAHKHQKNHENKPHASNLLQLDADIQLDASSLSKIRTHQKTNLGVRMRDD